MTRETAYSILLTYLKSANLIKHCMATEVTMKALYQRLAPQPQTMEEQEKWGITGLLHDADYELSKGHPELHGKLLFQKEPNRIPEDITYAIKSHNYQNTGIQPQSPLDWSITCCDQLTGLITAVALIQKDKRLASVTPESVLKKFNSPSFARGADREVIKLCEEKLGIPLLDFIKITLTAMQTIATDLGL